MSRAELSSRSYKLKIVYGVPAHFRDHVIVLPCYYKKKRIFVIVQPQPVPSTQQAIKYCNLIKPNCRALETKVCN